MKNEEQNTINNDLLKPTMKQFGWHEKSSLFDDESGWTHEGGEDAYYTALKK